jgi:hypothetical protein
MGAATPPRSKADGAEIDEFLISADRLAERLAVARRILAKSHY